MKLLWAWIRWKLAESDARNQRRFAAECEEKMHAARRGIAYCDQIAAARGAAYRNLKLARKYPLVTEKQLLANAIARRYQ